MTDSKFSPGQLVSSTAGRDRDKLFLVYDVIDESFVRVVDGDTRKIDSPKKKNVKHLVYKNKVANELAEKVLNGKRLTNAEIRKTIQDMGGTLQS